MRHRASSRAGGWTCVFVQYRPVLSRGAPVDLARLRECPADQSDPDRHQRHQHRRRQNNAMDEQEESKKVEELQQALSNSLQDTSAKRVPGALS